MFHRTSLIVIAIVAGQLAFAAKSATAGPILDWLFGRRTAYYSAGYCAPTTAYYPSTNCCDPCGTQCCQRVVAQYVPQTAFRTTYARVPVTSYRPVTCLDPCTGCPTTTYRPCTTQTWQARRVPITTYRPIYTTLSVGNCCNYGASCGTSCSYGSASLAPVVGGGCSSCTAGSSVIGTPIQSTVPSTVPSGPAMTVPGAAAPSTVPTPANTRPSLSQPPIQGSASRNQIGTSEAKTASGNLSPVLQFPRANQVDQPVRGLQVPVPDPDANVPASGVKPAPMLLDPRDKTASVPSRMSHSTISLVHHAEVEAPKASKSSDDKWDSSGWYSISK